MDISLKKPGKVYLMLLMAPFCKPVGLDAWPVADTIFLLWKLAAIVVLAVFLFPKNLSDKVRQRSIVQGVLLIFWGIYFLGCVQAGADVVSVGLSAVSCVVLLMLISYETRIGNGLRLLEAMASLFSLCILLHILSVFAVKAGFIHFSEGPDVYLFGYDNYSAFILYPMLAIVLFYRALCCRKPDFFGWGLMFALVFAYLYTSSVTAAFAGVLMIGMMVIRQCWIGLRRIMDPKWLAVLMAVFLVLICVFSVQNLFASMLNAMDKGITLNSRTYIWEDALELIRQKPIFGHGSFTQEQIKSYILYGTTHAHNLLLELLMRTGIVGTAAFLVFLCGFVSRHDRKRLLRSEAGILVVGLAAQLALSFMDFYINNVVFYLFVGVLYGWDRFLAEKEKTHPRETGRKIPNGNN